MSSTIQTRTLFIVDAVGAAISALILGVVLMRFDHIFGMPREALIVLAAIPAAYLVYDLVCLATKRAQQARFMLIIALLNLGYCCISALFAFQNARSLTTVGWAYFVGEILLVFALAFTELRAAHAAK